MKKISRRDFLKLGAIALGGASLLLGKLLKTPLENGLAGDPKYTLHLPINMRSETGPIPTWTSTSPPETPKSTPSMTDTPRTTETPTPTGTPTSTQLPPPFGSRVVHVHNPDASSWDPVNPPDPYYWNYVDQNVVNNMVDQGLMALTDTEDVVDAWEALLPEYQSGEKIAIKVNFNNTTTDDCNWLGEKIDAIIEPVNALIRGLTQIGVAESDIWIYDATKTIPNRFVDGCDFPGVQFYDNGFCQNPSSFISDDPNAVITFYPPNGDAPITVKITDVLIDSTYLINMPIIKTHGCTGVTLAFKNHFGTIDHPSTLHKYCYEDQYYSPDFSPLVEIYLNPHIFKKTILTVGDGIFGCSTSNVHPPRPWSTFNNDTPKSLFFATDPVAIDCVMTDFLAAENDGSEQPVDYLQLASQAGLGIFERGDPWGNGYTLIEYLHIDLP